MAYPESGDEVLIWDVAMVELGDATLLEMAERDEAHRLAALMRERA